jgi:hypothetical protein
MAGQAADRINESTDATKAAIENIDSPGDEVVISRSKKFMPSETFHSYKE